ncbi:hypothetical protein ACGF3K_14395 [Streptomyces sp. NPDC047980]|uniref:hypothetical protein n=1 Tax=Streptomyces sp. NPDC047980 TaxID=3365494 RepID=UPI00371AD4CB
MPAVEWDDLVVSLGLAPSTRPAVPPEQRAANTARVRRQRAARAARGLPADDPRHGKPSTYTNWGCRCPCCTAANTASCTPRVAASRARKAAA